MSEATGLERGARSGRIFRERKRSPSSASTSCGRAHTPGEARRGVWRGCCSPLAVAPAGCHAQLSAEGALFFDRGHYWIELAFRDAAGRDTIPRDLAPAQFEITKLGDDAESFRPSRIEIVSGEGGGSVVILSSGKLEGRCMLSRDLHVRRAPVPSPPIRSAIRSLVPPAGENAGARRSSERYVAGAFRKDGDAVDLNQFKYEYDFSDEKIDRRASSLEPRFRTHGLLEPLLEQSTVAYALAGSGETSTRQDGRSALIVSKSAWVNDLGLSLSTKYRDDRSALELAAGDSAVAPRCVAVEGRA